MRRALFVAGSFAAVAFGSSFALADGNEPKYPRTTPFSWSGMYIGFHSGAALQSAEVSDPFGPSIFGDTVRTPGALAGAQAGANGQVGSTVFGIEFDMSGADLDGTNTCFAFSPLYLSSNCRVSTRWLGTLTGRLGFAVGPQGRTLLYGKAGAAFESNTFTAQPGGNVGYPSTHFNGPRFGWTLGAGVEHALAGNWSVKAEYDYLAFTPDRVTVPASEIFPPFTPVSGTTARMSNDIHVFKLGLNYRLGKGGDPLEHDLGRASVKDASVRAGTELEIGARYVSGWGRFQKDLGGIVPSTINSLGSRLTYDGMNTNGAELFARLDTYHNFMIKGLVGIGSGGGKMNDEDWFLATSDYSNTLSSVSNEITYGSIDVGYDWLRGRGYRVASFVGYSVLDQRMKASGCTQIADPLNVTALCVPAIPGSVLAITEDTTWQALRIGSAADFTIFPRLTASVDAAYLPYVWFDGKDNHLLRIPQPFISPESGEGRGVQLDLTLSYAITDQLSLGVGGRYWAMWTTSADTNFANTGTIVPMRFAVEQAALTLQASYKFGGGPK